MAVAEPDQQAIFVIVTSGTRNRILGPVVTVGSRMNCDVPLLGQTDGNAQQLFCDPIAAEEHSRISFINGRFLIKDLQTSTGTFVNGLEIQGEVPLTDGAEIVVGVSRLTVSFREENGKPLLELRVRANSFSIV